MDNEKEIIQPEVVENNEKVDEIKVEEDNKEDEVIVENKETTEDEVDTTDVPDVIEPETQPTEPTEGTEPTEPEVKEETEETTDTADEKTDTVQEGEVTDVKVEEITDNPPTIDQDILEKLDRLTELEAEKEVQGMIVDLQGVVDKQTKELENFHNDLADTVEQTLNKFGIGMDTDLEELKKEDPAKYRIATDILQRAEEARQQVEAKLAEPIQEATNNIIYKKAGRLLAKYDLNMDQAQEAVRTFHAIIEEAPLKNIGDDLANKVEFAVARAKLIHKDVKQDVQKVVEKSAEAVKEIKEEVKEEVKEIKEEVKEVVKPKKDINDFKGNAAEGNDIKTTKVTVNNAIAELMKVPARERTAFYMEHQQEIEEAYRRAGGLRRAN